MMKDKVITFSVAAYNVEKYISQTLDSFICDKEIMNLFEVIIINDGSIDKTANIAKEYAEKYPDTFIVINKDNGGYGSTINKSLYVSRGKYFKLVDGDDWVDTKSLKSFINRLKKETADLVLTKYFRFNDLDGSIEVVSDKKAFKNAYTKDIRNYEFSKKLAMHQITYRTEVLKNIGLHITENCFYTDFEYNIKPLPYIRSVTAYNLGVYIYRTEREGQSVQRSSWFKNIDQATKVSENMAVYYEKIKKDIIYPKTKEYIKNTIADSAKNKYVILTSMPSNMNSYDKVRLFDERLKKASKEIYNHVPVVASEKWGYMIKFLRKTNFSTFKIINLIVSRIKK